MFKRTIFFLFTIVFLQSVCFTQVSKPKVSLKGQVIGVSIQKEKTRSLIKIKTRLELINEGNSNLIILASPITFPGRSLTTNSEENKSKQVLLNTYGGKSCENSFGKLTGEWKQFHDSLLESVIPNEKYQLKRAEKREFEEIVLFSVPNLISDKASYEKNKSLEEIRGYKALQLEIRAELYPSWGLEANCPSAQNPFGEKMREKWSKYGHLILNDIISEPIQLDLSSMIVKMDSKP